MLRLETTVTRWGGFRLKADVSIAAGERVALLGASGSGKSSLLALIAGFQHPDEGRILIDGQDMTMTPVADRPLSILFQDGNLFPHLSVFDNVALGLRPDLRLDPADRARVEGALDKVGLAGMGARAPSALSGGQQSRVALARMLLRDRPLALLDEPFAALDPGLRAEMLGLVAALCDDTGLTLIMASHDLRDAERLCDRLILLAEGQVVLDDRLDVALRQAPEPLKPWM
ncbi:Thiamin ABC transporter, ATPase component / Thiamine transport ATP-binding protein thiQ [Roseibacterium elongatum DSM 19469]|uniref:Thiamin ABC transporter, ATPase component / Thiamine transport ATP-binding protein thiQ n=1 Tax=Roseicyclus elongatus DSM 19469 TaxID=1294273 RepID=W8RQ56_9RHOB|nr:ATP-binding cassette domain-containing protein [Roseibacterium elongatum]AHM03304.1 Thiamin ABC transporter, ATPase component / Thiamine transport ATP-binding protein thiQ [Roseibacterium elongatum DSM 19469]